ncbi:hypothetical protein [Nonomuraea glycinis]|uniref:hypothetical protein n=1 Tax=Nonomuraea glycinis TaxID=2047744 RepID=UPI0033A1402E
MGIWFGRNANNRSYKYSDKLAKRIERKGGRTSTGASVLLDMMACKIEPGQLRGEEAEQAARSLTEVAPKLRRGDREVVLAIARDAEEASDVGSWTLYA